MTQLHSTGLKIGQAVMLTISIAGGVSECVCVREEGGEALCLCLSLIVPLEWVKPE